LALCVALALSLPSLAAAASGKVPVVPKWQRFERVFKSTVLYSNALCDATLTVTFTSPLGRTIDVPGFWDGGRVWRVRFAPDQPGRWVYRAKCSDAANGGLHDQHGEFVCSSPIETERFWQHGPVRVAHDRLHFEHADGTPFFWLADNAANGAQLSTPRNWQKYATVRASQNFSVAQWIALPGEDDEGNQALDLAAGQITVNPAFFQRLDKKVECLSQNGLLSAIIPVSQRRYEQSGEVELADSDIELQARYVVARYGAEPVAWLLPLEGDDLDRKAAFWKNHGPPLFSQAGHAPVLLSLGRTPALLDQFRGESWVDAFGLPCAAAPGQEPSDAAPSAWAAEAEKETARPIVWVAPCENSVADHSGGRVAADTIRRAVYTSLLSAPLAGVAYCAQGVSAWDSSTETEDSFGAPVTSLPLWERSLFLPGAKQMKTIGEWVTTFDFWRLQPEPRLFASPPSEGSIRPIAAAVPGDSPTLVLVYLPRERALELPLGAMPPYPNVAWLNPRSGSSNPAVGVVGATNCQFPSPGAGDWLLVLRSGKQ